MARTPKMTIENAQVLFRNFSGKEKRNPKDGTIVNREGVRNVNIVIDEGTALELKAGKWNVQQTSPSDEYPDVVYHLPIEMRFDNYPPTIWVMDVNNKTRKQAVMEVKNPEYEVDINELDSSDINILYADLEISPYNWMVGGKTGIKGYLKEGYFFIEKTGLNQKYANWGYGGEDDEEV